MAAGGADSGPEQQRGRGRPRKALDAQRLGPQRLAFVEALRTVFFDPLKDEGITYADISRELGKGAFSPTTLSRIADGQKLPQYDQYMALVALVPVLVGQPLTEKVEEHLWQLYLRAVQARDPKDAPYYQYLRDIDDVRRRQHAMLVRRSSQPPQTAGGDDDDPDSDHPAVRLRDEAAALLSQVARSGVPLPPQPLVTPPPGAARPPAVDALMEQTTFLLDEADRALRRHLAPRQTPHFVSRDETTPDQEQQAQRPRPAPYRSSLSPTPAAPSRTGHLHAQIWSVVLAVICVVLAVGYLLDRLHFPRDQDPTTGTSSSAAATGGASGGATAGGGGGGQAVPSDQAPKTADTASGSDGGSQHTDTDTETQTSPETNTSTSAPPESVVEDMQITADPSSGVVFCETVTFTLAVTTNQATTVDITWTPDDRLQQQRGARPDTRTLSFSAAQTVQDAYTVNLGEAHTGEQQKGTVTVTVSAPQSDSGKQTTGSFDLLCEPG